MGPDRCRGAREDILNKSRALRVGVITVPARPRLLVDEPAHLDRAFLTLDVEHVLAADPFGVPAGGRPRALGQVRFLVLVDRVVGNQLEGSPAAAVDISCCMKMLARSNPGSRLLP